ncbi:MAG: hypothetical protein ACK4L7_06080, partial [Flavobacteriales bacterium]
MNKPLLTIALLTMGSLAFGQARTDRARTLKTDGTQPGDTHVLLNDDRPSRTERGATFWTEDFSGGFPSGWSTTDIGTIPAEPPVVFVWTNDPQAVQAASNNNQFNGIDFRFFQSTTATNGYLWADSDRGLPSPGPTQEHITQLTTSAIDCSGQSSVLLIFQSTIGVFDLDASTNALVQVSTDGVNWTDYYPHPCLEATTPNPPCGRWSYNPENVEVDISATAANQPVVYLRWQWTGLWEYYWAIDDIELTSVPDYERKMLLSYLSHMPLSEGYEYGRIPVNHAGTMHLAASVRNRGLNAQTNLTIAANCAAPTPFGVSQNMGTVNYGDTAIMEQSTNLSSPQFGVHNVNFTVSSDQNAQETNPTDDAIARQVEISNDRYSLDGIGVFTSNALTSLGSNSFANNNTGLTVMNLYHISSPLTVLGLEVLLTSNTVPNSFVQAALRDTAGIIGVSPLPALPPGTLIAEGSFVDITAAHVSAGKVDLLFPSPVSITTPRNIFACVSLNGTATEFVRVVDDNTVPQPAWASCIHLANAPSAGAAARVYSNGNAFGIRLILAPVVVSVPELEAQGVTLAPNPTTGTLWFMAEQPGDYSIEVLNTLGERILTERTNGNLSMDLSP